jgi:cation:H+ antiporter
MSSLSTAALVAVFLPAAIAIWAAGISLSRTVDALDARFKLGDALGGLILLGFATSLPELAIVVSGAANHHLDLVIGNLIGGIGIQTALLALLDARGPREVSLTFLVGSLTLVIEAATVVAVAVIAIGGSQLPSSVSWLGVSPASVAIVVAWILGLLAVNRMRRVEPWKAVAPGAKPGRRAWHEPHPKQPHPYARRATAVVVAIFAAASIVTLAAGWALEESGNALASHLGMTSGVFGATVLALVTALPGISTGFAAIRLGDYALSMSEMFGGNAFAPTLFIIADVIAGTPTVTHAARADLWMAALGILLTSVFVVSFIVRPRVTRLRMGLDSRLVVVLYALGVVGLATIPGAS